MAACKLIKSEIFQHMVMTVNNPLCANPTKWSNTLKQLPTNCLSVFDHFVGLVTKGLTCKTYFKWYLFHFQSHVFILSLISEIRKKRWCNISQATERLTPNLNWIYITRLFNVSVVIWTFDVYSVKVACSLGNKPINTYFVRCNFLWFDAWLFQYFNYKLFSLGYCD